MAIAHMLSFGTFNLQAKGDDPASLTYDAGLFPLLYILYDEGLSEPCSSSLSHINRLVMSALISRYAPLIVVLGYRTKDAASSLTVISSLSVVF